MKKNTQSPPRRAAPPLHRLLICIGIGLILGLSACLPSPFTHQRPPAPEAVHELSLSGEWRYHPGELMPENLSNPAITDTTWPTMKVPNNWYLNGLDHAGVVWFRKTIDLHISKEARATLHFQGVDYACDVWVNGIWAGHHTGYFAPFAFDVTPLLHGGKNLIAVRVNSPNEEYNKVWSLRKRLIKGVLNHHDTRPGGAWSVRGQEKNSGGIWAPVTLRISEHLAITGLSITPSLGEKGNGKAVASVKISTPPLSDRPVRLEWTLTPHNFTDPQAILKGAVALSPKGGPREASFSLTVKSPRPWWPWELGTPNLYRLTVVARQGETVLDHRSEVFGFRRITRDPVTQIWRINGTRIFLRGTNYIASQWLSQMDEERLRFDLGLMKKAHINAIRVHAHVEPDAFYRLCDEMGLLVWQDFPLQWGYADDAAFTREAVAQAREMVIFLYNHPSIFTWCGHNEPPWDAQWMKWKYPDYAPHQNRTLDQRLMEALQGEDPTRPVQKHSSTDEHPWLGWYSGNWRDYAKPTTIPLISEFGAQALPQRSTLSRFLPTEALWPETEEAWALWGYHNFQRHEMFDIAGVSKGENLDAFIQNTQTYQAQLIQLAVESYRRQRFAPVTGIFQFMFVEGWPSINWGIVDYLRTPKKGYEALKQAYQPLLPSIEMEKEIWEAGEIVSARLWVINDRHQEIPGARLRYLLRDETTHFAKMHEPITIAPDSAVPVTTISRAGLPGGAYVIEALIEGVDGEILAHNSLTFRVKSKKAAIRK